MRVAILAVPDCHSLEVSGPLDVFAEATRQSAGQARYQVEVIAEQPGPLPCFAGLRILPTRTIADADHPIDTLIIAGARQLVNTPQSPALIDWVKRRSAAARRFGSICTGAFLLGAAGLLQGRRVATHWEYAARLAATYPKAVVEADSIFVRDGPMFSSAGVSAGIDIALALVEEDHGRALAVAVARWLVVFLKRPGGQSQFSAQLASEVAAQSPIEQVQQWIRGHPGEDLSVAALARTAHMSERNFSRQFRAGTGISPAAYVEATRLDAARAMLEDTRLPLQRIAVACGFAGVDALRRAFVRRLGVTALDYRQRFRSTASPPPSAPTRPNNRA